MSGRVALVASTTADVSASLLDARLRHLLADGWDAWLLCSGDRWRRLPGLRDATLRHRIELAPTKRGMASPFGGRLRSLHADLVHFHSGWAAWKALRRGQPLESRIIITLRDDGQDLAVPRPGLLWERADLLLFTQRAALDRAVARGWPERKATVLHTPPGCPAAASPSPETGRLRILSAGSLIWEQGYEHSVHAVRLLLDAGVDCSYRIIGEGEHVAAIAFARHQLGVTDRVHLLAPDGTEQLAAELRHADVFLDPAVTSTTSPAALAAAQASGLPAVATFPGVEGATIGVPRRDPRAIADALLALARDPALRARMAQAGREAGTKALDEHLAALQQLYRDVLARARRGAREEGA